MNFAKSSLIFLQLLGLCNNAAAAKGNLKKVPIFNDNVGGHDRRLGSSKGRRKSAVNFCASDRALNVFSISGLGGVGMPGVATTVHTPFMLVPVKKNEGILVEASVSTLLLSGFLVDPADVAEEDVAFLQASVIYMSVVLTNNKDGTTMNAVPSSRLPLQIRIDLDAVGLPFGLEVEGEQSTGRFYFPDLPKGDYMVQIQFDLFTFQTVADGLAGAGIGLSGSLASLGPHLISVEKVEDSFVGSCGAPTGDNEGEYYFYSDPLDGLIDGLVNGGGGDVPTSPTNELPADIFTAITP